MLADLKSFKPSQLIIMRHTHIMQQPKVAQMLDLHHVAIPQPCSKLQK